jgi:DNA (cytosine-5)-methyltransferase 1
MEENKLPNGRDEGYGNLREMEAAVRPFRPPEPIASVVDIFCGVGGLSHGFLREGFLVGCGLDVDAACRYPFEANNAAPFWCRDVAHVSGSEVTGAFEPGLPRVLAGCAPCQPFSLYTQARIDPKWTLLSEFARLVEEIRPDIVSVENVRTLLRFKGGQPFHEFTERLRALGLHVWWDEVFCPKYGVPQSRTRLVLLASRFGSLQLTPSTAKVGRYQTAMDAIGGLPPIGAGESDPNDPLHAAAGLSPKNIERIRASKPGGTWRDWPMELRAKCHTRETGYGYSSVYGRMRWDEPSPTITTQFHGFGNGRFGHPDQDRGLSLREGAILQTFPAEYKFVRPGDPIEFAVLGRLIGNAVPVALAQAIAKSIRYHLERLEISKCMDDSRFESSGTDRFHVGHPPRRKVRQRPEKSRSHRQVRHSSSRSV